MCLSFPRGHSVDTSTHTHTRLLEAGMNSSLCQTQINIWFMTTLTHFTLNKGPDVCGVSPSSHISILWFPALTNSSLPHPLLSHLRGIEMKERNLFILPLRGTALQSVFHDDITYHSAIWHRAHFLLESTHKASSSVPLHPLSQFSTRPSLIQARDYTLFMQHPHQLLIKCRLLSNRNGKREMRFRDPFNPNSYRVRSTTLMPYH